ncbi:transforming growth factor beta activator LRRC32 [Latimeria chalumnae]|uniref:transforming growth factor beta activator LRRC32 n=1 Tax=Latimeria chalumnae TaxID=7897 RepID=UPI0006D91E4C|nr:PREDICTED: leucine-rich repeat-containing protein 32-like [Latimeria chalumnae]|eukprot:XP_014354299.1 PREDICTED: leucine-rich repeat-containing protein 32-like [Latimeria chalumnae]
MRLYLILILAVVQGGISTFRPREFSPCHMVGTDMHCQSRNLSRIPSELPPNIDKLDLSNNLFQNITAEPLRFYISVQHLDLSSNKIDFIHPGVFTNMTNLEFLSLANNFLDSYAQLKLRFGLLPNVRTLDLSGNSLFTGMAEYFIQEAPSLQNLSLSGNSIVKIAKDTFSGSLCLTYIDLHNNFIMEIEEGAFEVLANLSELNLAMNSITCISSFNLTQLQVLDLQRNSIELFHTAESEQEYKLKQLDLSENKLMQFPVLPKRNQVIYLDLSKNLLQGLNIGYPTEDIDFMEYIWLDDPLQVPDMTQPNTPDVISSIELPELLHLDLSYNEIKSIPENFFQSMISLKYLNLSKNCLQNFTVNNVSALNSLATLDLSFNALRNLSIEANTLKVLRTFYLQGNYLHTLTADIFQGLANIQLLNLNYNNISVCGSYSTFPKQGYIEQEANCVSFSGIPTLQHLYLSNNNIKFLPKYAFLQTPLTILDLSFNQGMKIKETALTGLELFLQYLYLQSNKLEILNIDLQHFSYVKQLNLSENQLTRLPPWNRYSSLELLDLRDNKFISLQDSNVLALEKTLKTLYLSRNPLSCCSNSWIQYMIQRELVQIPDLKSVKCRYPENYEYSERELHSLNQEDCEKEDITKFKFNTILIITVVIGLVMIVTGLTVCYFRRQSFTPHYKA